MASLLGGLGDRFPQHKAFLPYSGQPGSEQAIVCGAWLPQEAPPFGRGVWSRVPGMFMPLEGASPSANLMEVKVREAQGRHREVGSEGSVYQKCEPTNRNWIEGASVGRVSVRSRSPYPSRANGVNPAVVH